MAEITETAAELEFMRLSANGRPTCEQVRRRLEIMDKPNKAEFEAFLRENSVPFLEQIFGDNGWETRPDSPGLTTLYADGKAELRKTLGGDYWIISVMAVETYSDFR